MTTRLENHARCCRPADCIVLIFYIKRWFVDSEQTAQAQAGRCVLLKAVFW